MTDEWFKIIVSWSDLQPEVDAFASSRNKKLPSFWTAGSSAFLKYWKHNVLWLNPPFSKLNSVVEKILQDEAQGIFGTCMAFQAMVPCLEQNCCEMVGFAQRGNIPN